MKISPEPDWDMPRYSLTEDDQSTKEMLETLLNRMDPERVITVRDTIGNPLGSFTPEWFLSLPRRDQLRFLSVAKRMHERSE